MQLVKWSTPEELRTRLIDRNESGIAPTEYSGSQRFRKKHSRLGEWNITVIFTFIAGGKEIPAQALGAEGWQICPRRALASMAWRL